MVDHAPTAPSQHDAQGREGHGAIDRWLAERYQLAWLDRSRVRTAVFGGRRVEEPHLAPAARGLAAQVLAGGFGVLRWSRMLGWAELGLAIGLGVTWVVWLITGRGSEGVVLLLLVVVNAGLLLCAGAWRAWLEPRQVRRHEAQALRVNRTRNSARPQRRGGRARSRRPRRAPASSCPGVPLAAGWVAAVWRVARHRAAPCEMPVMLP